MVVVPATVAQGSDPGAPALAWSNATVIRGQHQPVLQGWYSKSYDQVAESDATKYSGSISGPGNATAAWLLFPWRPSGGLGIDPVVTATVVSVRPDLVSVVVRIGPGDAGGCSGTGVGSIVEHLFEVPM